MQFTRLIAAIALSIILTLYTALVYYDWDKNTPAFFGGPVPEPNDSTALFFIFGMIAIWSLPKLWQQIFCGFLSLLGIWLMDSLLDPLL